VAEIVLRGEDSKAALTAAIDRALASTEMQQAATTHSARLQLTDPPGLAAALLESLPVTGKG
jgi:hypothetical protein